MSSAPWPPKEGLSTPVIPRKDNSFSVLDSTHINAPASVVFDAVRRLNDYSKWNSFVPEAKIAQQPDGETDPNRLHAGTIFTFYVVMNSSKPNSRIETSLQCSDLSTPEHPSDYLAQHGMADDPSFTADLSKIYRISWKQHGGFASRGLKTERFHEIFILGDNECELRVWENYGGILATTLKWMYQSTLNDKFQLWNADLKKYAESLVAESAAS